MKIAVISDIHGNYDALLAVLKKAKLEEVNHLLILGDIVGYYYHPDKILEELSEWSFDMIKGNHEYILEDLIQNPSISEIIRSKYGSGHQQAIEKLSLNQLEFLKNLPETKSVKFEKTSILMNHGSPWSNNFYIYPDCDKNILEKCDSNKHDFVLIGHSHYQFAIKNNNSILINPGSVGQSRQSGGKAYWCTIDTGNKCFQLLSTAYNVEKLIDEVTEKGNEPNYLSQVLRRN
ncbi:metallophosphoesterase family protein [Polaribacter sp. BAL334]|uniref:metallophosphoesterase family protein n=1 Tax=Polaribacter sp. BAL334 TaxID=1708178 RepID=UPI0018D21371|nr:metallophosphoesterase family protein [Polaribacter sp. BAL334]MBG7612795.1 metallophosphoesterase family protein [Polaribacter sp. BAL334]